MTRVLLVEDDPRIARFIARGLAAEGYRVDHASGGREALALAEEAPYPLVILDRMLPGMDGAALCRTLRDNGADSMVLMLTARDSLADKIEGLAAGADDYLTKPFAFDELLARLQALMRRAPYREEAGILAVGDLVLDPEARTVRRGPRAIELTAKEFALLHYLMRNPGKALSRARILSNVWGYSFEPGTKLVDVYVRYLRAKLGDGDAALIRTVRGIGYCLAAPDGPLSDGQ
ncbi:response regulator transcription factor [Faunimonas sp. B44]|uniref:response regulator transcription factor n=1 Tax=Faunimonas sp. B44 TaxID=3461493 RepID=UPI004044DB49